MNKHSHDTPHGHHKQEKHTKKGKHTEAKSKKREPHKDWRLWIVVGIMLVAMAGYVVTMDESLAPGGNGEEVPAAAE
ncbi:MAG: hypothetical protein P8N76_22390 [Pirellulaceae bacterium]|nr:hypothetical protein [Pirellulaceae bacterium]